MAESSDSPVTQDDGWFEFGVESGELWWQEWFLDGCFFLVIGDDLGEGVEVLSDGFEEGPFEVLVWVEGLEIVRVFGDFEVDESQVAQSPLLIANEGLDEVEFGSDLFEGCVFDGLVLFVPEEAFDFFQGILQYTQDVVDSGSVLDGFSEEFFMTGLEDDVSVDGGGFGKFEISVNQIG